MRPKDRDALDAIVVDRAVVIAIGAAPHTEVGGLEQPQRLLFEGAFRDDQLEHSAPPTIVSTECTWGSMARCRHEKEDASPYPIVLAPGAAALDRAAWGSAALPDLLHDDRNRSHGARVEALAVGPRRRWLQGRGPPRAHLGPIRLDHTPASGARGLELRIDREGFVERGSRVAWAAVMSILWRHDVSAEHLEMRVRNTEGYRAPSGSPCLARASAVRRSGQPPDRCLETAALLRRIQVLAVEPRSKGWRHAMVDRRRVSASTTSARSMRAGRSFRRPVRGVSQRPRRLLLDEVASSMRSHSRRTRASERVRPTPSPGRTESGCHPPTARGGSSDDSF